MDDIKESAATRFGGIDGAGIAGSVLCARSGSCTLGGGFIRKAPAMPAGRCRMHGGGSTGPKMA
jgi:hypothetical protein